MTDDDYNDIDLGDGDFNIEVEDEEETELLSRYNDEVIKNVSEEVLQASSQAPQAHTSVPISREGVGNDLGSKMGAASTADLRGKEVKESSNVIHSTLTSGLEQFQLESDPLLDDDEDEFDKLLAQMDETEIINKAYHEHAVSVALPNGQTTAMSGIQLVPVPIKNANSSSGSLLQTPPVPLVANPKVPAKSSLKRQLNSEISAFFSSSQEDSYNSAPVKRSFPGPAGLLPRITANEIKQNDGPKLSLCERLLYPISKSTVNGLAGPQRILAFSKTKVNVLLRKKPETSIGNGPWRSLVKSLNLNLNDDESLLNKMNIDWVKEKANKFQLLVKIPLLVLVVKEDVDVEKESSKSKSRMCVRLMDHSGVITAVLDNSFVNAYGDKIVPGTTLGLQNCRILLHRRSVILTVSNKNVLCLSTTKEFNDDQLTPRESNESEFPSHTLNEQGIHILQRAPFTPDKIMQDYEHLVDLMARSNPLDESENAVNRMNQIQCPLFSTVSVNGNTNQWIPPHRPAQSTNTFFSNDNAQVNFANDDASGFDDDDDAEFLKALEGMEDFEVEED